MPRVRRKGHIKRDAEIPLTEWSLGELRAELKRVEANPREPDPWAAFKRTGDLQNELWRRDRERNEALQSPHGIVKVKQ